MQRPVRSSGPTVSTAAIQPRRCWQKGRVYFQSEEGVGTVIKASKAYEQLAVNDLGERIARVVCGGRPRAVHPTEKHLFKIASAR